MFLRSLCFIHILDVRLRVTFGVGQIKNLPLKTSNPDLTKNFKKLSTCENLKVQGKDIESSRESRQENASAETGELSDKLVHWVMQNNISYISFSRLLKILHEHGIKNIPKNSRAVLQAKEDEITVQEMPPGVYYHFGLEKNLKILINHLLAKKHTIGPRINISIFIDELVLSTTNRDCLWVILGSIAEFSKLMFGVGVYRGKAKPNDSNIFLSTFVSEAAELLNNGLIVNGINFKVAIKRVICDAPAKAFILNVQPHTGYSSCTKCWVVGEHKNKVCFPGKSHLKTDEDFRKSTMYKGRETELLKIPNFGVVSNVPLDYMHLVCFGTVRKLLTNLLSKLSVKTVCERIQKIDKLYEFESKLKLLTLLPSWNAKDFRQFLLYHGPVVLNGLLDKKYYDNFLHLHIACRLLCMEHMPEAAELGKNLLDGFIEQFKNLYGIEEMSHNVHGLQHLVDDYIMHGPLDSFSSFLFEKFLLKLKRALKKSKKRTIPQLILNESYLAVFKSSLVELTKDKCRLLREEKTGGDYSKYMYLFVSGMRVSSLNGDNYVLLKNNRLVKVVGILKKNKNVFISGKEFSSVGSFYKTPVDSTKLSIFQVSDLSDNVETWSIFMIDRKCLKVPVSKDKSVLIGLLNES